MCGEGLDFDKPGKQVTYDYGTYTTCEQRIFHTTILIYISVKYGRCIKLTLWSAQFRGVATAVSTVSIIRGPQSV